MLKKIPIISKNASNKNCSELNFLQKTQWKHISIFLGIGPRGLQRLPFLKYDLLEWEAGKCTDYIRLTKIVNN